jgi:L-malate glycosyltransferase
MKILYYNHTGQVSGAERMLLMILARLDRARFTPVVVCPAEESLKQMVIDQGTPVETIGGLQARFTWRVDRLWRYLQSVFAVVLEFRQKVKQIEPELIHANSIRAGLVATLATIGLGTRVLWHLHDMLPHHPLSMMIRLIASMNRRTRMIAVSQCVADNFAGGLSSLQSRMNVVLNAIELEQFTPGAVSAHQIRTDLKLPEAGPLIGIVGQLTARKGQLELIRAFARVTQKMPEASLLIVGAALFNRDKEYAELLKNTAKELGIAESVVMTGARKDVALLMQSLDLLVVNSKVEPFGLVALEAMACGVPVLSTASGGTAELIRHDENGWLVPVGDEAALAMAMINLVENPSRLKRLADQGRRDIRQSFGAARYIADLHSLYARNGDSLTANACDKQPGGVAEIASFS